MGLKYNLDDTIPMMQSEDYKVRLKGEYWQLCIRLDKLRRAIHMIIHNELKTDCFINDLRTQFQAMIEYKHILEYRADHEGIDLENIQISYW